MGFYDSPTLDEIQRTRRPNQKPLPSVVTRAQRKAEKKSREDDFRDEIWRLDGRKSRASGKPMLHGGTDPTRRGQVAHIKPKGAYPELAFDVKNAILLSDEEHRLSDPRTANAGGKALLEIRGTNANGSLTFIRRDVDGRELWRRSSTRKAR